MLMSKGKDLNQFQIYAKGGAKVNLLQSCYKHIRSTASQNHGEKCSSSQMSRSILQCKEEMVENQERGGGTAAQQLWQL